MENIIAQLAGYHTTDSLYTFKFTHFKIVICGLGLAFSLGMKTIDDVMYHSLTTMTP